MRLQQPGISLALVLLTATCLLAVQFSPEALRVATVASLPLCCPTSGTLDERPFFASRRHPAVDYDNQPKDPVAQLVRKLEQGTAPLRFEGRGGYLLSVLEALGVPAESQSVVFSKTSLQSHYISPTNPRAIYFTDNVSVAFVRDAPLLEISALDPKQGVVFYAIEQRPQGGPRSPAATPVSPATNRGIPSMCRECSYEAWPSDAAGKRCRNLGTT